MTLQDILSKKGKVKISVFDKVVICPSLIKGSFNVAELTGEDTMINPVHVNMKFGKIENDKVTEGDLFFGRLGLEENLLKDDKTIDRLNPSTASIRYTMPSIIETAYRNGKLNDNAYGTLIKIWEKREQIWDNPRETKIEEMDRVLEKIGTKKIMNLYSQLNKSVTIVEEASQEFFNTQKERNLSY